MFRCAYVYIAGQDFYTWLRIHNSNIVKFGVSIKDEKHSYLDGKVTVACLKRSRRKHHTEIRPKINERASTQYFELTPSCFIEGPSLSALQQNANSVQNYIVAIQYANRIYESHSFTRHEK